MSLANIITLSRLLLTPIIVWAAGADHAMWAAFLFVVAAGTDALDGWAARARNEVSSLGKLLDPIADKALQLGVLFSVVSSGFAPTWLIVVLLAKEVALLAGGLILLRLGHVVSARALGKAATVILFVALGGGLADLTFLRPLLYIGAGVSLLAGLDYAIQAFHTLSSRSIVG